MDAHSIVFGDAMLHRLQAELKGAIAEIHRFASRSYTWVLEGDIEACFDEISHPALMDRVRERIGDTSRNSLVLAPTGTFMTVGGCSAICATRCMRTVPVR